MKKKREITNRLVLGISALLLVTVVVVAFSAGKSTSQLSMRSEFTDLITEECPQFEETKEYNECLAQLLAASEEAAEWALSGKLSQEWKDYRDGLCASDEQNGEIGSGTI